MSIVISICIPTFNRPKMLKKCLDSILLHAPNDKKSIEICISNNNSDENYSFIEDYLYKYDINNTYFSQLKKVSIDENMLKVISMASGKYVLLLGDDDFLTSGIEGLLAFTKKNEPDLLALSGEHVDAHEKFISEHNPVFDCRNLSTLEKFDHLVYLLPFGSLLVKKSIYDKSVFDQFMDTYHAYASFWITFLKMYERGMEVNICSYEDKIVALRASEKTYDTYYFDVVARGIPDFFNLIKKEASSKQTMEVVDNIIYKYNSNLLSIKNTFLFILKGVETNKLVELFNKSHNFKGYINIFLAHNLSRQKAALVVKFVKRAKGKWND